MGFELLIKRARQTLPVDVVAVNKCSISFGANIVDFFKKQPFVEIYLDKEDKQVGFKASNNIVTGFKLEKKGKSGKLSITAKQASTMIPLGQYPTKFEKGLAVISVPSLAIEK